MQQDSEPLVSIARTIETIDHRRMRESDARAIAELLSTVWPKPGQTVELRTIEMLDMWHNYRGPESKFPRSLVIRSAGRVLAHAEVSPRIIGTSVGEMTVGALAGVCTDPRVRGKGLGTLLVRAAFELVDNGTYPFAMFQNYEDRRAFYEHLGARAIENPIVDSTAANSRQNPFWADLAMIYPADKPWPVGEIDLRGPGY